LLYLVLGKACLPKSHVDYAPLLIDNIAKLV
jgi:hypothetical protein